MGFAHKIDPSFDSHPLGLQVGELYGLSHLVQLLVGSVFLAHSAIVSYMRFKKKFMHPNSYLGHLAYLAFTCNLGLFGYLLSQRS